MRRAATVTKFFDMDEQDGQDQTNLVSGTATVCIGFILYILFIHVKKSPGHLGYGSVALCIPFRDRPFQGDVRSV
jgi:hypothetical protein